MGWPRSTWAVMGAGENERYVSREGCVLESALQLAPLVRRRAEHGKRILLRLGRLAAKAGTLAMGDSDPAS
jgi:hypothetical protein